MRAIYDMPMVTGSAPAFTSTAGIYNMFRHIKDVLNKRVVESGVRILYSIPEDTKRHVGRVRFHATDRGYWLVSPDDDDTLDLVHESDIKCVLN